MSRAPRVARRFSATSSASSSSSGATCSPDLSACAQGNTNGLCKNGACSACADPADDASCAAAYKGQFLCLMGACSPGNCRGDGDCHGMLCGLSTPNLCGACESDAQCQAHPTYGASAVCVGGVCKTACTGTTWMDLSGHGHDGTLQNFDGTPTSGWVGTGTPVDPYALRFDGQNDFVALAPGADGLRLTDDLTLDVWVAPLAPNPGYDTVFSNRDGTADYSGVGFSYGSSWTAYSTTTGSSWVNLSTPAAAGPWIHLAFTYSKAANASALYTNGVLQAQGSAPASLVYSAAAAPRVGEKLGAFPFPGRVAVVRMWSAALAAAEVAALFQKDAPRFGLSAPSPTMSVNQPLALFLDAGKCGP